MAMVEGWSQAKFDGYWSLEVDGVGAVGFGVMRSRCMNLGCVAL